MKKRLSLLAAVLCFVSIANSALIDFESIALGDYTSLDIGDAVITAESGKTWSVIDATPGDPIGSHCIGTWPLNSYQNGTVSFFVNFQVPGVNEFKIGVGDYNQDIDNCYLEAYDAANNLIASDYYMNPASKYGGDYVSVNTNVAISYVKFWDSDPYTNHVYWDNMSYSAVPEPATISFLGITLLGLAASARRKRS